MRAFVWGGGFCPNIVFILVYASILGQRHRAFFHVCYFYAQYFIITNLRTIYHQPRPYEADQEVYIGGSFPYAYTCQASYGLPSGHALSSMALSVYVALDFILARRVEISI